MHLTILFSFKVFFNKACFYKIIKLKQLLFRNFAQVITLLKLSFSIMYIVSGQNFSKTCKEFGIGPVDEVVGTVVQIIKGHDFTEDVRFRFQEMMDISRSEYKDQVHFKYNKIIHGSKYYTLCNWS